jgi:GT2 family glycosyltransferase
VPDVSVIVPARDAEATIETTLAAIRRQTFEGEVEVIVVDDGSVDATGAVARNAGARVERQDTPRGAAAARNRGARAAGARVLAFTDADCEPAPGWLAAGVAALHQAELVQGAVKPTPGVRVGPFDRTLSVGRESPLYESANVLVHREWFERAGGFPAFQRDGDAPHPGLRPHLQESPFGEDVRFGWSVRRVGGRTAFAEDAEVHHAVVPRGPAGFIGERWRLRYFPALARDVPELRTHFPAGLFLTADTARFDLAVAGVVVALVLRRAWPLLAAAPYARATRRRAGPWARSTVRVHAAQIAADAVGLAALAVGSLAARRPLL